MSWQGTHGYPLTSLFVQRHAPPQAGVYVLYRPEERAIYVGESGDIRTRLLAHLQGGDDEAMRLAPTHFAYELVPVQAARLVRERVVIRELNPVCNAEPVAVGVVGA